MKKIILMALLIGMSIFTFATQVSAGDRCFGCKGGTYVKYTGKADNAARKKAEKCGCKVSGTAGCPSNKKKILCSVD